MKQKRKGKALLWISIAAFAVMSASFLLMPFDKLEYLPGILFWAGLLVGVLLQILLEALRRRVFARYGGERKQMQKKRCGALCFFSLPEAKSVDIILLCSIIALAVVTAVTGGVGYICYILLAVTVLAFCLHCILNGRNYFFLKNYIKIRRVLENRNNSKKQVKEKE